MLAVMALAAGVGIGLAGGGSLQALEHLRIRREVLIVSLFVLQAIARGRIPATVATPLAKWAWVAVCILLITLLTAEFGRPGVALVQAGLLLNVIVVVLNGVMPVAIPMNGLSRVTADAIQQSGGFYQLAHPATLALFLGDVLPIRIVQSTFVVSAGDLVTVVGVAALIAATMQAADAEAS